jgi:hypothetical protein
MVTAFSTPRHTSKTISPLWLSWQHKKIFSVVWPIIRLIRGDNLVEKEFVSCDTIDVSGQFNILKI